MKWVRQAAHLLSQLPKTLRLIYQAAGALTVLWLGVLIVQGLLPGLTVYLTKLVLDGAEAAFGKGSSWESMRLFLIPAVLMGAVMLLSHVLAAVQTYVQAAQSERLEDHVQELVQTRAIELDLAFFDASESYDRLERASGEAGSRTQELLSGVGGLLQAAVSLFGIAAVLLPYGLWLPAVLVLGAAPSLWIVVRHNSLYHQWWRATTPDRRRATYYNALVTDSRPAAEMRLLGLGAHYRKAYAALRRRLRGERLDLVKRQGLGSVGAGLAGLATTGAVMAWVSWRALQGAASLGDLGLFYRAFNEGQKLLRTLLGNAGRAFTSVLFVEHLFEFLELRPTITTPTRPQRVPEVLRDGVRFEDVTFQYQGTERPALDRFSIHIPAGKVTAIVGPNGAGKSTLSKLICRLYDPDQGAVTFDGIDIRSFDVGQLRQMVTIMLQAPIAYQATAAHNIAVGDFQTQRCDARLLTAAEGALIHDTLDQLPRGYETQLGRYFGDGIELSGGQWQRVMLARAFYRQSPIVVLDEPTSDMDTWAENEWLQGFGRLVEGRTTCIITHRFTTAMHADVIHVMLGGEIVESGSHRSLLASDGYYAQSWRAQVEQGWRAGKDTGNALDGAEAGVAREPLVRE